MHSVTNPSEPVIGYICIGSPSSQRIFIKKGQLPGQWKTTPFYTDCELITDQKYRLPCCYYQINVGDVVLNQVDEFINYNKNGGSGDNIPISALGHPGGPPTGYTAASKECTDCTLRGTNKKPAFWQ
jgi:hypothetical protein